MAREADLVVPAGRPLSGAHTGACASCSRSDGQGSRVLSGASSSRLGSFRRPSRRLRSSLPAVPGPRRELDQGLRSGQLAGRPGGAADHQRTRARPHRRPEHGTRTPWPGVGPSRAAPPGVRVRAGALVRRSQRALPGSVEVRFRTGGSHVWPAPVRRVRSLLRRERGRRARRGRAGPPAPPAWFRAHRGAGHPRRRRRTCRSRCRHGRCSRRR